MAWGTSSKKLRRIFSRMNSATMTSSGWSVSMSAGNHAGPSGRRNCASSTKASTLRPVSAESATMASQSQSFSAASRWALISASLARSVLESTQIFAEPLAARTWAATHSSPRPMGLDASMSMATTSTSSKALMALVFSSSPRASWGLCKPGVSTMIICTASVVCTARKRWRVVWAVFEVMAIFLPMMAFRSVDFPALGRPTSVTNPLLKSGLVGNEPPMGFSAK